MGEIVEFSRRPEPKEPEDGKVTAIGTTSGARAYRLPLRHIEIQELAYARIPIKVGPQFPIG